MMTTVEHPIFNIPIRYGGKSGQGNNAKVTSLGDLIKSVYSGDDPENPLYHDWITLADDWPTRLDPHVGLKKEGYKKRIGQYNKAIKAIEWLASDHPKTGAKTFDGMLDTLKMERAIQERLCSLNAGERYNVNFIQALRHLDYLLHRFVIRGRMNDVELAEFMAAFCNCCRPDDVPVKAEDIHRLISERRDDATWKPRKSTQPHPSKSRNRIV